MGNKTLFSMNDIQDLPPQERLLYLINSHALQSQNPDAKIIKLLEKTLSFLSGSLPEFSGRRGESEKDLSELRDLMTVFQESEASVINKELTEVCLVICKKCVVDAMKILGQANENDPLYKVYKSDPTIQGFFSNSDGSGVRLA